MTSGDITRFTPSEANVARKFAITDVLLSVNPGAVITYVELSRLVGFSVRDYSSLLSSVKIKLIKDYGIVFSAIRGEGLVRLTSQGILAVAESRESTLRRRSSRNISILICVNRDVLNADEQKRYDVLLKNSSFVYSSLRDDTVAEKLAPFVHYPKNGPEIGPVLRQIFGSQRKKLKIVPPAVA